MSDEEDDERADGLVGDLRRPRSGSPTLRLTSCDGRRPAASAQVLAHRRLHLGRAGSPTWTRRRSPDARARVWILASAASMPLSLQDRSRASVGRLAGGVTSQATPPSKSMPRLRPRADQRDQRRARSAAPEMAKPMRRRPTKSKVVSPWYSRCQRLAPWARAARGRRSVPSLVAPRGPACPRPGGLAGGDAEHLVCRGAALDAASRMTAGRVKK